MRVGGLFFWVNAFNRRIYIHWINMFKVISFVILFYDLNSREIVSDSRFPEHYFGLNEKKVT